MTRINSLAVLLGSTLVVIILSACERREHHETSRSALTYVSVQEDNRLLATSETEIEMSAYLTGYSFWDNTPNKSAIIAMPFAHPLAGGVGTYDDPTTLAVGHAIVNGQRIIDYPAGTKFYIPFLRKYTIVEDLCGDGGRPQDGPCHSGYEGYPWFDIYVDGETTSPEMAQNCMAKITRVQTFIMNPRPGRLVSKGALTEQGCQTFAQ